MIRKAKAVWRGSGRAGSGNLSTDSGVLAETPYSFKTRFENEKGTNPEELIAAAHAGCFTMALAFQLQGAGYTPTELNTEAAVTLEPEGQGFRISRSALTLRAQVPNLDEAAFSRMASDAEKNCPVSKVLNAAITKIHDPIEDSNPESWTESWTSQWQINVLGPARLMCAAIPQLKKQGGGVIVTMSSWVANRGASSPTQMAYAASKAGITAAARTVARAYARDNILCYMIAPGIVRTKMSEDFAAVFGGEEKLTATLAMGEWVPPGEIGHLIAFLATGKCRHLTGATLDVNGATYVR